MKKEIITRRLKLLPSVDERDRDNYIMHLKERYSSWVKKKRLSLTSPFTTQRS